MRHARALLSIGGILLAGGLLFAFYQSKRVDWVTGNQKFPVIAKNFSRLSERLRPGLTKQQVLHILGKAQNVDNETVWMWVENIEAIPPKERTWMGLQLDRPGFFVAFYKDRLVGTLFKTAETNPREILREHIAYGPEARTEVERLLGPSP